MRHLGADLRDAFDAFERELLRGFAEAGAGDLRQTHNAVLRYLDPEGSRASVLAERAGLTRQAMTQIVDDLERLGYVRREPDPRDRRAKVIVYTERGREVFEHSRGVIAAIERRHAERLGAERYRALREGLAALAA